VLLKNFVRFLTLKNHRKEMRKSYTYAISLFLAIFHSLTLLGAPVITNVDPNFGPTGGGNMVTITGSGFTGATAVDFGTTPAVFTVNSDTSMTATAPAGTVGNVNVIVTAPSGSSSPDPASFYVYQGSWQAYISSLADAAVVPLNLSTNTFGASIPVGGLSLANAVITPDGRKVYVPVQSADMVVVIDVASNSVIASILVGSPSGMAMAPDGSFVYVVDTGAGVNTITKIDVSTDMVVAIIPTGGIGDDATDIAITPDGLLAYVINSDTQDLTVIDLTTDTVTIPSIPVGALGVSILRLAITPDGKTAYVTGGIGLNPVDLTTNTAGAPIAFSGGSSIAVAITPDGSLAYGVTESILLNAASTATNMQVAAINVGLASFSIAITPDGLRAYLVKDGGTVEVIDVTSQTVIDVLSTGLNSPLFGIVITPDQAPVAAFSFTSPNTFDASRSVASVGGIASYAWDFGDGSTLVTTSPIVTHNYAVGGVYSVTLTVTDTAGTSTTRIYTGHVLTNNGGSSATLTQAVTVPIIPLTPPLPPSHFAGKTIENKFATQTDIIHCLKWKPSPDQSVFKYELFRNGRLIAVIPASGPFVYLDHNRRKNVPDTYTLIAVSANGLQSLPVTTVVPRSVF